MYSNDATINPAIIRQRLSPARLQRYEEATAYDLDDAMDLYLWNVELSAAFYAVLQGVEVILRNALSEQMTALHRDRGYHDTWFDDPFGLLDERRRIDIEEARFRLRQEGHQATQDRLITKMSFGFWRYLLSAHNEHTLWVPALRKAFPFAPTGRRRYIADRVERLHHLRNRIAHHEPVFRRRLARDMAEALDVVGAIDLMSADWLDFNCTAAGLLIGHVPMQRRSGG